MKTRFLIILSIVISVIVVSVIISSYFDQTHLFSECIEGRNYDGTCIKPLIFSTNFDHQKYITVFDEGSPIEEIGTGNPVLTEDNCYRYAFWLTKYQKEKLDKYEDYPRYPPWGNQIFPLVDYCTTSGNLIKTVVDDKIEWRFQLKNEN